MIVAYTVQKMIDFYKGNLHDIDHFLKVWAFAKTIGEQETDDAHTLKILEIAAIVHDIACPLCREKYGTASGKNQELESPPLIESFFEELPVGRSDTERISWLVAHHHTYTNVDSIEHQVLLEADFLVNAAESGYSKSAIKNARNHIFKTDAGIRILDSIYLKD